MSIPRFYSSKALCGDSPLVLDDKVSAHIARVLRMRVGEEVILFDGNGGDCGAKIIEIHKKAVIVQVGKRNHQERESPLAVHLGIGMSRGERMDFVIQKATELGVSEITPLATERCGLKLKGERQDKKRRHWQGVAISACEQCGRNRVPEIHDPVNLESWLALTNAELKLVLHHRASALPSDVQPSSLALLIGPEGGLSEAEIEHARDRGFAPLTLGPRVLRTETAPLAALAIVQSVWGDMALLG
ncbi:MAG: 16S rRNA (uracil(1498)-N(3))-methyltransferase [Gammaproteobacteria bacterium]|nr:MAG: 16S rRNA (uracil(1498)-N(3))-methyltransferase [Gammaproteobacteria bacterium]